MTDRVIVNVSDSEQSPSSTNEKFEHVEHNSDASSKSRKPILKLKREFREYLAEFLGTLVLIIFGDGVVAQVVLSKGAKGDWLSINWGWGLGVLAGVYIAGGISGAHLNPAVTITMATYRGFPWKKVPGYCFAQLLGAFTGAALVFANYRSALNAFDGGVRTTLGDTATAGVFATFPAPFMTPVGSFFSEVIGTAVLLMVILATGDKFNNPAGNVGPIVICLTVLGLGASWGWETGYAINPARDLGPRLFTLVAGWGTQPFTAFDHYFWVPMFGTTIGGLLGGLLYDIMIYQGEDSPISPSFL
ncbi:uncharacterized protein VTP21DRAFT_11323 [Calcarisporiella thermophila]|uniref:uncharacterized protein n=1 Tax=Calcarisporiella thermophila TaxID=911321 RepID=UPI0037438A95